ncbi:MAG: hypothetical protein J7518_11165 [Nocardioidaceae bacterium]|nr:hypothetical protein [Nocardioidaceae bacterium]
MIFLVCVACDSEGQNGTHVDGNGPLSASSGNTRATLPRPPQIEGRWSGTFGGFKLCRTNSSGRIELLSAQPARRVPAHEGEITPFVRTLRPNPGNAGIISAFGSPPDFAEPYAQPHRGDFRQKIRGFEVKNRCGRKPDEGFDELLINLASDTPGIEVDGLEVAYTYKGRPHTLHISAEMILCGDTPEIRRYCEAARH